MASLLLQTLKRRSGDRRGFSRVPACFYNLAFAALSESRSCPCVLSGVLVPLDALPPAAVMARLPKERIPFRTVVKFSRYTRFFLRFFRHEPGVHFSPHLGHDEKVPLYISAMGEALLPGNFSKNETFYVFTKITKRNLCFSPAKLL